MHHAGNFEKSCMKHSHNFTLPTIPYLIMNARKFSPKLQRLVINNRRAHFKRDQVSYGNNRHTDLH